MTDEQIIKALSCCQHVASNCIDCPFKEFHNKIHDCEIFLHNEAHLLMCYQYEEIKRYKGIIKQLEKDVQSARTEGIKELAAEMRKRKISVYNIPVYLIEPFILDMLLKEMGVDDDE